MNEDIILLLKEILKYDLDKDWKELKISRKGFNLLVYYLEYLQNKVFYLQNNVDELERYLKESE